MGNRWLGKRKINFTCSNCDNEFTHDGKVQTVVKCPKCLSKDLWGKPFHVPY